MEKWVKDGKDEMEAMNQLHSPRPGKRPRKSKMQGSSDEDEDSDSKQVPTDKSRRKPEASHSGTRRPRKQDKPAENEDGPCQDSGDDNDDDLYNDRFRACRRSKACCSVLLLTGLVFVSTMQDKARDRVDKQAPTARIGWLADLASELEAFMPGDQDFEILSNILRAEGLEASFWYLAKGCCAGRIVGKLTFTL